MTATTTKEEGTTSTPTSQYNLRVVIAPIVRGFPLLLFAKIIHLPFIGPTIIWLLKAITGLGCVNRLVDGTGRAHDRLKGYLPLYYPFPDLDLLQGNDDHKNKHEVCTERSYYEKHQKLAENFDLESFIVAGGKTTTTTTTTTTAGSNEETCPEFRYWTIRDYLSKYQSQELTPDQVAVAIIKAVKHSNQSSSSNKAINAIVAINEDDVLEQARQSTERYRSKQGVRPLEGVPIAIKDDSDVKNYPTTQGTTFYAEKDGIASKDCITISRLRNAGAIIVGKTNMHEMGFGTTGFNWSKTGFARNPFNTRHYTGGSSSGSAAAVAAGLVPLAFGMDAGGSIRIPSSLCGIVGLKPTFGRDDFDNEFCSSLAHVGPMGASVSDVAIGYAAMAGSGQTSGKASGHVKVPPAHLARLSSESQRDLSNLKVGIYEEYFNDADPEVVEACWKAVRHLESLGAEVIKVSMPYLEETKVAHVITILTDLAAGGTNRHYKNSIHKFTPESQISIAVGRSLSSLDYLNAQKFRRYVMEMLYRDVFSKVDVLLTPGSGCTAPVIKKSVERYGESNLAQTTNLMRFIYHGNLCGIPGIVVPIGYSKGEKLPMALQIQAPHWDEDLILRLAESVEVFAPREKPLVYYDIFDLASKVEQ